MIYLLWCTANPELFIKTHQEWMDNAVHPMEVKTLVAVDSQEHADMLDGYHVIVTENPRHGITVPLYILSDSIMAKGDDIIIVPSDDFFPPTNWDMYLRETFYEFDGVFKVNDGYMKNIISMPVMTYSALLKLNRIIYHPSYTHMFSDRELQDNAEELGILKCADLVHPEFEHRHYVYKKRKKLESDIIHDNNYDEMMNLYEQRKRLPLNKRLIVDEF